MKIIYLITLAVFLNTVTGFAQEKSARSFSLEEAIAYAKDSSYQSQSALLDVYHAKKRVWEAKSIGLPQINASADYNYNIKNPASPFPAEIIPADMRPPGIQPGDKILLSFGTKQTASASISASQKIFDGSYIVALQSAQTVAKITELAYKKTDVLVEEAVSSAYVTVLVGEESIQILKRNIANVSQNENQLKVMFENGLVEQQDVEQLQLNLASLKNNLERSIRLAKINEEMLKFAMGIDIGQSIVLSDPLDEVLFANYQLTDLEVALDLPNHIDYQISENNLKTNELLVKYEKSKYMPNISAFLSAGYNSYSEIFDFFQFKEEQWAPLAIVGLQLNIPVFSSFQRKARVDMAKIDLQNYRLEHERLTQSLFLNLSVAQDSYAYSIDNYLSAKEKLKLAESIEQKENIKYQEGIASSLDLTNAQNQLYTQQDQYLNAISSLIQAKLELDKALDNF